jgi:UDP-N-acetylmuramyl pentapeptide phosphotransferase/UDP-N-acetylglucosamine-1-phosphate transferase
MLIIIIIIFITTTLFVIVRRAVVMYRHRSMQTRLQYSTHLYFGAA